MNQPNCNGANYIHKFGRDCVRQQVYIGESKLGKPVTAEGFQKYKSNPINELININYIAKT
jgi:hypothetical protein